MVSRVSANIFTVENVVPTLSTSAYAANDHCGTLMTLNTGIGDDAKNMTLLSMAVVDGAKQSSALNVLFFDEAPTLTSSDNAILDISDAEMADKFCGLVSVVAGDYSTLNANSAAFVGKAGVDCKYVLNGTLYAIISCQGTPTYAAGSLTFRFTFLADL